MRRAAALSLLRRLIFWRRRSQTPADPAAELRLKLAAAREREDETEAPAQAAPETPDPVVQADEPEPEAAPVAARAETPEEGSEPATDLDTLRRSVRERAQALAEEMRGGREGD